MAIDDADLQRIRQLLAPDFRKVSQRPRVLTTDAFPTTALDGDQAQITVSGASTGSVVDAVWSFTYNAAEGYWYPTGAAPLVAFVAGSFASSATATWQDTLAPKITVPFAGDYLFDWSTLCDQATSTVWPVRSAAIQNGTLGPSVFAETAIILGTSDTLGSFESAVGVTAATGITIAVYTNDGVPAHTTWLQRALRVTPLRCR